MNSTQENLNGRAQPKKAPSSQTALLNLFLNDEEMVTASHEMAMPVMEPVLKPHISAYHATRKTPLRPLKPGAGLLREFILDSRILMENTQIIINALKQAPDDMHSVATLWRLFQMVGETSDKFGFTRLADLCAHAMVLLTRVLKREIPYSRKCAIIVGQAFKLLKKDIFHYTQAALGGYFFSGSQASQDLIGLFKTKINKHQPNPPHFNHPLDRPKGDALFKMGDGKATTQNRSDQPDGYTFKTFIHENRKLTAQTEVALLFLKHNPGNRAAIETVLRYFDLIGKRATRFKFDSAAELCTHTSALLASIRDGKISYAGRNADLIVRAFTVLKKEIFLYTQAKLGGEPFSGSSNSTNMITLLEKLGF